ncbi:unnamed protein product [Boreogadus saida]
MTRIALTNLRRYLTVEQLEVNEEVSLNLPPGGPARDRDLFFLLYHRGASPYMCSMAFFYRADSLTAVADHLGPPLMQTVPLHTQGYQWVYWESQRYQWVYWESQGYQWVYWESQRYQWVYWESQGYQWVYWESQGYQWVYWESQRYQWVYWESQRYQWVYWESQRYQ